MSSRWTTTLRVAAAVVLAMILLIFVGESYPGCLGPIGVTKVQCIAAFDATFDPDWSPGPGDGAWIAIGLAVLLAAAAVVPWHPSSNRLWATLVGAGLVGAFIGAAIYGLSRQVSLTGPTSLGAVITVTLPFNPEAQRVDAVLGAGLAVIISSIVLRIRSRRAA